MNIIAADILNRSKTAIREKNPEKKSFFTREINLSFTKNTDQLKQRFFSEASVLISSGLNLKRSLEIIFNGMPKAWEKEAISSIHAGILKGDSFSEAVNTSDAFSKYDYYSVKTGEEGGTLPEVLHELSVFYEKRISQKRQIKSALTYPVLVLITTIFSLAFMLNYIVPMFRDVFLRVRGSLPPVTQFVIGLSEKFPFYLLLSLLFVAILTVFISLNRKKIWFRRYSSLIISKTPVAGHIVSLTYKTRFCQTMRLLTSSRVHLLDAIDLIRQMIEFYPMEYALGEISQALTEGKSLAESMDKYPVFDRKMIALTRVAEEVNKLDLIYGQLYRQYADELDTRIKTMNNLLEPVLIIFVGALVAFILISMYMPIFQIGTSIS